MTGILIVLGMNVILWKILVKLMFAKTLAGQPCLVGVSGHYDNQEKQKNRFFYNFGRSELFDFNLFSKEIEITCIIILTIILNEIV